MQTSDCADNDVDSNTDCDISTNAADGSDETDIPSVESDVVKSMGLFCLKLKENYGASETVVSNLVTDVLQVMKQFITATNNRSSQNCIKRELISQQIRKPC